MITNAGNTTLNQAHSNLPNLSMTITKWFISIDFVRITKTTVDFETVETESSESFQGVVQNLDSKQLQIYPEAQRAWGWKMIHALPSLIMNVDDRMIFDSIKYRVMNIRDYKEYGYMEYHIVEDYRFLEVTP